MKSEMANISFTDRNSLKHKDMYIEEIKLRIYAVVLIWKISGTNIYKVISRRVKPNLHHSTLHVELTSCPRVG